MSSFVVSGSQRPMPCHRAATGTSVVEGAVMQAFGSLHSLSVLRHGRSRRLAALALSMGLVLGSMLLSAAAGGPHDGAAQQARTNISLTFDRGASSQLDAARLLEAYGLTGTFYVNTATVGTDGFLTRADLDALAADGNEVGGHTVSGKRLSDMPTDEVNRQICTDRNTLLSWGFDATSFAYPGGHDATAEAAARHCGYNTARDTGGPYPPSSCLDCAPAQPLPPANAFRTTTADAVDPTWTLGDLQRLVRRAERAGGWQTLVFHDICDGCSRTSISPDLFERFLHWLSDRKRSSTAVSTVGSVVGGQAKAAVLPVPAAAPPGPGDNAVRNPSLEDASCWSAAGDGMNTPVHDRVADPHTGAFAARLRMPEYTDGYAMSAQSQDLGACAPSVAAGERYTMSAWYRSDAPVRFVVHQRNGIGQWRYWTTGPSLPATDTWRKASWTTPAVPAGTAGVSFGLALAEVGTLTSDDYTFSAKKKRETDDEIFGDGDGFSELTFDAYACLSDALAPASGVGILAPGGVDGGGTSPGSGGEPAPGQPEPPSGDDPGTGPDPDDPDPGHDDPGPGGSVDVDADAGVDVAGAAEVDLGLLARVDASSEEGPSVTAGVATRADVAGLVEVDAAAVLGLGEGQRLLDVDISAKVLGLGLRLGSVGDEQDGATPTKQATETRTKASSPRHEAKAGGGSKASSVTRHASGTVTKPSRKVEQRATRRQPSTAVRQARPPAAGSGGGKTSGHGTTAPARDEDKPKKPPTTAPPPSGGLIGGLLGGLLGG
ncbi:MAG: polysaccharide deacetylase family protein [Streptosporangiales bacterium]|nr:polysaccharide deacetylase family protein [Streptosporangiales bacterium]